MPDQWPTQHPAPRPLPGPPGGYGPPGAYGPPNGYGPPGAYGPPGGYGPPQIQEVSARYRRWAGILLWLSIALAGLMVVAFVASFFLLVKADAHVDNAVYGYLAIFLWFGITAAVPVLVGLGIPAITMRRRVRQQERLGHGGWRP
ncbi:hypothetical protein ACQEVY_05040 [Streptomyces sp. CA-288835]|uniref:hypothetical protein n=1 Tax=Streptomyces sp. CA-288835 TaxID=3240069 RepID=UPI003D902484